MICGYGVKVATHALGACAERRVSSNLTIRTGKEGLCLLFFPSQDTCDPYICINKYMEPGLVA